MRVGRSWPCGLVVNLQIVIAAKVLVQLKNLLRLKGSLEPCLVDTNTTQHLPHLGELQQALRHLYSGSEPIKEGAGEELPLSQLQNIAEVTSSVKNKKEEEESDHWCRYKVPHKKVPNHKIPNNKVLNKKVPK
jgi:hypothetical protein